MGKLQYFTNLNSSAIWGWFPWNKPWFQGSVATWGRCDLPCIHQTTELANQGLCVLQFCILGFLPLTMNLGPGYHLAMCSGTHWQTCRGFLSHDGTPNHEKKKYWNWNLWWLGDPPFKETSMCIFTKLFYSDDNFVHVCWLFLWYRKGPVYCLEHEV